MGRAGTGWRCKRGERKQGSSPFLLCVATRVGYNSEDRTRICNPSCEHLALLAPRGGAWGLRVGGKSWGWGHANPMEERAGTRHSAFYPFFSKRSGGGAESLSLGHVIVLKSELRGSRRLGDHYKTQPGERVSATTAAAASPAQDRPGRAAAAATRTAERTLASLASSWHW